MGASVTGDLNSLVQLAVAKPSAVKTADGGAILALSLHCCMVSEGFRLKDNPKVKQKAAYRPAGDWNSRYENEWVFEYTRPGYRNVFVLHCSLQTTSGKMFVHGSEQSDQRNISYMGLNLQKYIPDLAACTGASWAGVVQNQDAMTSQFRDHILQPLLSQAVAEEPSESVPSTIGEWLCRREVVIPAALGVTAAAAAVVVYLRAKRPTAQP
ncbi:hypothetical protein WJX72_000422 [[Myrmecia] bisecta]|uniref:PI31 proteasome regulator N-terminal domain-containing protein n=1 Tax=[Myrmecia] bisecta TaxID=41462 RepID=A0AAW1NZR3_9CHLO